MLRNHLFQHSHPQIFGVIHVPPGKRKEGDGTTRVPTANKLTCFYMLLACACWIALVKGGAANVFVFS